MSIDQVRAFFMWCTIINAGFLFVWFVLDACAGDWIYRIHSKCFPMSRGAFNIAHYSGMGLFKMGIIVLNLVPYIALMIVTR